MGVNHSNLKGISNLIVNGPMEENSGPYPVILFSPGFGVERDMYLKMIEILVLQRYIVVTLSAPHESVFTVYPEGQFIRQQPELSRLESTDYEGWHKLLDQRSQSIIRTLEQLTSFNHSDDILKGMLNLDQVIAVGHSLGGAAIFEVAKQNRDIKATVLLDPSFHLIHREGIAVSTPSLILRQEASSYEAMAAIMNETIAHDYIQGQQYAADVLQNGHFYRISGAQHMSFSDVPLHYGDLHSIPIYAIVGTCIAHFLNETLSGNKERLSLILQQHSDTVIPINGQGCIAVES
ncbi:alpha/beta hydrolase family protein [Paenibacillus sp. IHBB 3054]|uniref:alpha/beta hydrolase family protein n=1 Tax=Paenibacillus sp. IHBB 3054 TaxID=3425689 RepID=UPI003F6774E0